MEKSQTIKEKCIGHRNDNKQATQGLFWETRNKKCIAMTINKHSKGRGKGKQPKRREHTMEKSQTIIGHGVTINKHSGFRKAEKENNLKQERNKKCKGHGNDNKQ